jgi:hypothetical protein
MVYALGIGIIGFVTRYTISEQRGVGSAPVIAVATLTGDLQVGAGQRKTGPRVQCQSGNVGEAEGGVATAAFIG